MTYGTIYAKQDEIEESGHRGQERGAAEDTCPCSTTWTHKSEINAELASRLAATRGG